MRRYLIALATFAAVGCFGSDTMVGYQPYEKVSVVTPKYLTAHTVPFHFGVTEQSPGVFGVTVTLGPDDEKSGTSARCCLLVADNPLPKDDAGELDWALQASDLSRHRKVVQIPVPSKTRKVVSHLQLLNRAELERAALCVIYAKPGYGGDSYWVLLGRFIPTNEKPTPVAGRFEYFRGYFSLGEALYVSVGAQDQQPQWLQVGTIHRANQIVALDLTTQILTVKDPAGDLYQLPLTQLEKIPGASPVDSSTRAKAVPAMRLPKGPPPPGYRPTVVHEVYPPEGTPRSKAPLNWEWVDSEANPMRQTPVRFTKSDWEKCRTDGERNDLIEHYRQHGWEVTVKRTNKSLDIDYIKLRRDLQDAR